MTSKAPEGHFGAAAAGSRAAGMPAAPPVAAPPLGAPCPLPDPIAVIEEEHALHRELCDLLEALADALPGPIDRNLAAIAVDLLETSIPQHVELEEKALFPLLRARAEADETLCPVLGCLESEHETDLAFGYELCDTLRSIAEGAPCNAEMIGYMLRGYFESQRRHLALEDKVVLPAARQLLRQADLAELQGWIMRSHRPRCVHQSVLAIRAARAPSVCASCASTRDKRAG